MSVLLKTTKMVLITFLLFSINSCNNLGSPKAKSNLETADSDHIILINPFEVPQGKLEESITYWEACRDFLKKQPGYISTELHQSIKDNSRFQLINVAVWESTKAFTEASQKMAKELGVPPPEELKANPSLYTIIRK